MKEAKVICSAYIDKTLETKDNKKVVGAGHPIGVCVIDKYNTIPCHKVMDEAFSLIACLSRKKAQNALELLRDTKVQREICQSRGVNLKFYEFYNVGHAEIPSGCVIKTSNWTVVEAIRVSSWSPQGDEEMAQIGVKVFETSVELSSIKYLKVENNEKESYYWWLRVCWCKSGT